MREQVDGTATRAREQVGESAHLIGLGLREEPVGGGADHDVRVANGNDRARQHANLDRLRSPMLVDVGRLIRDVQVDVNDLARDRGSRGEQRNFFRFTRAAIDHRSAGDPTDDANRSGLDVAQERRDDRRHDDKDAEKYGGNDEKRIGDNCVEIHNNSLRRSESKSA